MLIVSVRAANAIDSLASGAWGNRTLGRGHSGFGDELTAEGLQALILRHTKEQRFGSPFTMLMRIIGVGQSTARELLKVAGLEEPPRVRHCATCRCAEVMAAHAREGL